MAGVDHLIVGAGTAGCVLAARLSEDPSRRVLVLEAGPDFPDEASLPASLRDGAGQGFDAGLTARICAGRVAEVARGRVVGGSSQVNAYGAVRALAADFDAWAALGLPAWEWPEVLESYRRLETDHDFPDGEYHGGRGPVPIVRPRRDELTAPMDGFLTAVLAAGHPYRADMNAPDATGIGPYPQNRRGRVRMSANLTHLAPARGRPNLTVLGNCPVERVLVRDGRAVGVRAGGQEITAGEVILCAGVPMTPALLLRSGIGAAGDLRAAGVPALVDVPGVGRGVRDQPGAVIPARPAEGSVSGEAMLNQLIARLEAIPGHATDGAFYLNLFTGPDPYAGQPVSAIMVGDMRPGSLGTVRVAGPSPAEPPVVDLGFYREAGDLERMVAAYRHAWAIAQHPAFTRTISGFEMVDDALVADDDRLREALRAMTFSRLTLHGGAAMGPPGDPEAVVDERCRVHGVGGLRVVDLSVVPVPLRGPTALDAMMLGEHAAGWIAAGG
ncbi:GMC family oxidoreductase [Pseudonocardia acaciae]|uniref:GMC family oxidoreductase n=1 Tax=Pseudonocardia acaciae TaxID=551276 RepID=UPI0004922142|nr:GMC family oxidoreductase N-terminal domain-containing protein [Pseudonocardia acaciae]